MNINPDDAENPHHALGAYVLGGLPSDERAQFETHLSSCERCRADLTSVAGLPALLRTVTASKHHEPSVDARNRLLARGRETDRTSRQRRRRRTTMVLSAAIVVAMATAAATAVVTLAPHPATGTPHADFAAVGATNVTGSAAFEPKPWGTALDLTVTGLPASGTFSVRVIDASGHDETAATWAGTSRPTAQVTGATSTPTAQIRSVQIVRIDGRETTIAEASRPQ